MGLAALTSLGGMTFSDFASSTASDSFTLNSSYAVESGIHTYTVKNGCIMHDGKVVLSDSVSSILCRDEIIYYSSENCIKSYEIASGNVQLIEAYEGYIKSFTMTNDGFYVYDTLTITSPIEGALLSMLGTVKVSDEGVFHCNAHLPDCLFFELSGSDALLLYFDNPAYDPDAPDSETNPDQYEVYKYDINKGSFTLHDINALDFVTLEQEGVLNSSGSYKIGDMTFPMPDYPVGSFFTKNGKCCSCHNQGICVAAHSSKGCNCMRYWPSEENMKIDLKSSQCWGFAEFCEYQAYGYYDKTSPAKFKNAFGSKLSAKTWTASDVKETFTSAGAGGHLRVGGHSLFVISVSSTGFITYECNKTKAGGYCQVYTQSWTWDSFYSRRYSNDILWYYVPKDRSPVVDEDPVEYKTGRYQVKASSLNLRESDSTSSKILASIPNDTIINITEFNADNTWGKTEYNGNVGWVSLDYVFYLAATLKEIRIETLPNKLKYYEGDSFSTEGLAVYANFSDGTTAEISGYICSGYNMDKVGTYTVKVSYEGFTTSFTIEVEREEIYPQKVTLDVSRLALLTGDSYELFHTVYPADANMLELVWSSSDLSVASVENGYVTTHKPGKATIKVKAQNAPGAAEVYAECEINVVDMPKGTAWSVDVDGMPLKDLPLGITPLDYSVRYRVKGASGSYGAWQYIFGDELPAELQNKDVEYQYRAITVSFISEGKDALTPKATDINTYVYLDDYQLEREGYLFAGWFKDGQSAMALDKSGAFKNKVLIEEDTEFYAGWVEINKPDADKNDPLEPDGGKIDGFALIGAQLAIENDSAGIRFYSRISTSLISRLGRLSSTPEYGTVVILKSALKKELEIDGSKTYLNSKKPIKVKAKNIYEAYDDYVVYTALVTGYDDSYIDKDFAARPYIKYTDVNGNSHTHYYTCTGKNVSYKAYYTSLYDVAEIAYKSADALTKLWISENILDKK